jgi:putative ABC transport system ATP-binding protein
MTLYELRSVSHRYNLDGQRVQALHGIDLVVRKGEFMAIAGPSGSGKTTLLNVLGLLEPPCEGTVLFDGADVSRVSERERTLLRRERLGFIFQTFNLIPVLSAYENVEYFLLKRHVSQAEARQRVRESLDAVGISAQSDQRPNHMSGGQRQRVAIARALVRDAEVMLADEPTAALDQTTGQGVMDLMKRLNRERGVTFVFSTHDPRILSVADRVIQLRDGRVIG